MLLTAVSAEHANDAEPAGLLLLASDDSITRSDAVAERWLAELRESSRGQSLPPVVAAVASRARSVVDGRAAASAVARARVCTASGRWLLVRGSTLGAEADAPTAVIIEAARPHELAPLIADAYGLTERERAITQLVAQGLATQTIARRLHISPWTVQNHLKSIFEKVDVSTRGELVARMFFDHYAPRLTHGAAVASNGWFAPPSPATPARGHDGTVAPRFAR
jgi:DNA-binding CsgD family transcriptional regulator